MAYCIKTYKVRTVKNNPFVDKVKDFGEYWIDSADDFDNWAVKNKYRKIFFYVPVFLYQVAIISMLFLTVVIFHRKILQNEIAYNKGQCYDVDLHDNIAYIKCTNDNKLYDGLFEEFTIKITRFKDLFKPKYKNYFVK